MFLLQAGGYVVYESYGFSDYSINVTSQSFCMSDVSTHNCWMHVMCFYANMCEQNVQGFLMYLY